MIESRDSQFPGSGRGSLVSLGRSRYLVPTSRDAGGLHKPMAEKKFEASLARLEEIVKKLETGDLPLEQSLKLFEEGVKLARACNKRLEGFGTKLRALRKRRNLS